MTEYATVYPDPLPFAPSSSHYSQPTPPSPPHPSSLGSSSIPTADVLFAKLEKAEAGRKATEPESSFEQAKQSTWMDLRERMTRKATEAYDYAIFQFHQHPLVMIAGTLALALLLWFQFGLLLSLVRFVLGSVYKVVTWLLGMLWSIVSSIVGFFFKSKETAQKVAGTAEGGTGAAHKVIHDSANQTAATQ